MSEENQSMLSSFYRERSYWCGDSYKLVSVVPRLKIEDVRAKQGRKEHTNISRPAQQNLNKRNSNKYFRLLIAGNFKKDDYFLTLTYDDRFLPKTAKEAKTDFNNFIRRVRTKLKKEGKADLLKYVVVTEYREKSKGKGKVRFHHHVIINNIIDRDVLEQLWTKKAKKGRCNIGTANTKRVRTDGDYNLDRLAKYMCGWGMDDKKTRDWSSSKKTLKRPQTTKVPVDYKYKRNQIEALSHSNDLGQEFFEKKYPKYFVEIEGVVDDEYKGIHYYLKLTRKDRCG